MNLELLIKLVKLANNNPNDNEANRAARKVCVMIAENDYKFDSYTKRPINLKDAVEDMINDIRRYNYSENQDILFKKMCKYCKKRFDVHDLMRVFTDEWYVCPSCEKKQNDTRTTP